MSVDTETGAPPRSTSPALRGCQGEPRANTGVIPSPNEANHVDHPRTSALGAPVGEPVLILVQVRPASSVTNTPELVAATNDRGSAEWVATAYNTPLSPARLDELRSCQRFVPEAGRFMVSSVILRAHPLESDSISESMDILSDDAPR